MSTRRVAALILAMLLTGCEIGLAQTRESLAVRDFIAVVRLRPSEAGSALRVKSRSTGNTLFSFQQDACLISQLNTWTRPGKEQYSIDGISFLVLYLTGSGADYYVVAKEDGTRWKVVLKLSLPEGRYVAIDHVWNRVLKGETLVGLTTARYKAKLGKREFDEQASEASVAVWSDRLHAYEILRTPYQLRLSFAEHCYPSASR